ncbi:NUDIX domain-containing protein [Psychromarinibacter sp. S121]|uniref:NUDIX domain-containing protein n=1 Tax=Psychromarinibacter sp. S121 TaxID=3415127 RepID=UPI003C7BA9EC
MTHRISAGAMVLRGEALLLARHFKPGRYDFWAPPGGGAEGAEELAHTAERECFEETGIRARARHLAYIDELIDSHGRMVKFWYVADYVSGEIDVTANPAEDESISDAAWFTRGALPDGHVFPEVLHGRFWDDLAAGFPETVKLPLKQALF